MTAVIASCPLCDCTDLEELYLTWDRHYGIPGNYRVVRCASCTLVFLNPMYSNDELKHLYPTDYYAYQKLFGSNRWKRILKRILGFSFGTKDPHFERPGRMLDVGCGSGWFLESMRSRGWTTYGVEINESAVKLARDSMGLDVFCGTLQAANFPAESFDYIRSNHSFEHMSDPHQTLDAIYRVLKPQGKLHIGVPNINSLNARIFKRYWWYLGAPVHPFNYSVSTMSQLLVKHHFRVERVCFNSDFFGILGSLQIWLNRKNGRKSSEGAVVNSFILRFMCQWTTHLVDLFGLGDEIEITAAKGQ